MSLSASRRACGGRIASRTDELREEDVGTGAGLFQVKQIGDEYFTFVTECRDPKACTVLLRGASKEILAVSPAPSTLPSPISMLLLPASAPYVCSSTAGGGEEPAGRHAGVS